MPIDDLMDLDIDLNHIIDRRDLANLDLDNDSIPDSIDSDLAGIVGMPDQYKANLTGSSLPDRYEADLNNNSIADKLEKDLLGGPLKEVRLDVNNDGQVDAIDAMILRNLIDR